MPPIEKIKDGDIPGATIVQAVAQADNAEYFQTFTMRYRERGMCHDLNFEAENLTAAIALAKRWCEIVRGRKMIYVQAFCHDLQKDIDKANQETN